MEDGGKAHELPILCIRKDGQCADEEEIVDTISFPSIASPKPTKFQRLFSACSLDRNSGLHTVGLKAALCQSENSKQMYSWSSFGLTGKFNGDVKTRDHDVISKTITDWPIQRPSMGINLAFSNNSKEELRSLLKHNGQIESQTVVNAIDLKEPVSTAKDDSSLCLSNAKEEESQRQITSTHYELEESFLPKDDKREATKDTLHYKLLEAGSASMIHKSNDKLRMHDEVMDGQETGDKRKAWEDSNNISSQMSETTKYGELGFSDRHMTSKPYDVRDGDVKTEEGEVLEPILHELYDVMDSEKQYDKMVMVDEMLDVRNKFGPVNNTETFLCLEGESTFGDCGGNIEYIEEAPLELINMVSIMNKFPNRLEKRRSDGMHVIEMDSTVLSQESDAMMDSNEPFPSEAEFQQGIMSTVPDLDSVLDKQSKPTVANNGLCANEAQFQLGFMFEELDPVNVPSKESEARSADNGSFVNEAQYQLQEGIMTKDLDLMIVLGNGSEAISAQSVSFANEAQFEQGISIIELDQLNVHDKESEASSTESMLYANEAQLQQGLAIKELDPVKILDNTPEAISADIGHLVVKAEFQQGSRMTRLDPMNEINNESEVTSVCSVFSAKDCQFQQNNVSKELVSMKIHSNRTLEAISAHTWSSVIDASEDQFQQGITIEELKLDPRATFDDDVSCANEYQCQECIKKIDPKTTQCDNSSYTKALHEAQCKQDGRIKELDPMITLPDGELYGVDSNEARFQVGINKLEPCPMQLACVNIETQQSRTASSLESRNIIRYWTIACKEPGRLLCYMDPVGNLQYGWFCDTKESREARVLWGLIESRICILSVQFLLIIIALCLGGFFDLAAIPPPT